MRLPYLGVSAKARERLHAMRMKLKPGYANEYLKSLGFNAREIEIIKRREHLTR
jgi:hypothetical protein